MSNLRHIHLKGTPAAMGRAFGEQCREDIRAFTMIRLDCVADFVCGLNPSADVRVEDIRKAAAAMVDTHRRFSPAVWEEFEGIAQGSGVPVADLIVTNGLTDLQDYLLPVPGTGRTNGVAADHHECTALMIPASCSPAGPIVGQTWDMHDEASNFIVIVHRAPEGRPATVGLTTTGCLCLIGLNESGLAVGNTNLTPTDAGVGVNYLFTITEALSCTSVEGVAEMVIRTPKLSGHNFYAADRRDVINLECSARRVARTDVVDGPFLHTNHYLDPALAALEYPRDLFNSTWRLERIRACFKGMPATPDPSWCWDQLRDVSQACVPDEDSAHVTTVAGVLMQPADGLFHVGAGTVSAATSETVRI